MTVPTHTPDDADAPPGAPASAGPADDLTPSDERSPTTARMPTADDAPTEQLAPLPLTAPLPLNLPPRPEVPKKKKKKKRPEPAHDAEAAAAAAASAAAPESSDREPVGESEVEHSTDAEHPAEPDGGSGAMDAAEQTESGEEPEPDAGPEAEGLPDLEDGGEPEGESETTDPDAAADAAEPSDPVVPADAPTSAIPPIGPETELPPQKRPAKTRPKQLAWSNLPNSEPIPLGAVAGGVDVTGTHPTLPPITAAYTAALAASAATSATPTAAANAASATVASPTAPTATTATIGVATPDGSTPEAGAEAAPAAKKKKKRRRRRALIVTLSTVVVVLALAGVAASIAWNVGETRASSNVKQTVQQKVDKAFGMAASHPVSVTFDEPVLPQIWAGTLDTLNFTVAGVPLMGSTATVTVHATEVPTSGTATPKTVETDVRLKADALKSLVEAHRTGLGQILPETVKVSGDRVTVSLNPAQFLSGVSFTEVLTASVKDGNLVLTPKEFVVGGQAMSADTVRARFGALAQGILATRTICLTDAYPSGMTLTGLDVKKDAVVADFDVEPGILSDPALQAKGTCK